ncbi:MAG: ABC transporter transmembrane domain-containing protein [Alphaproteobacteria bacterium]|nr:ABC transporter transmembrane domain-containing protein [Alphaproteobacteria bacterium]
MASGWISNIWARFQAYWPHLPEEAMQHPPVSFSVPKTQLAVASLIINLLSLALPILTLQVYDRLLVSQNIGTLRVLASGVVVVVFLDIILRLGRSYIIGWAGAAYEHAVSCNAMRHILGAELAPLENEGVGAHLQRMNAVGKMREFLSGQALVTLIDLPFVLIFLTLIFYLTGWLVLVPLGLLALFTGAAIWLGKALKQALEKHDEADNGRMNFIIEALEGVHSLKSLALEPFFQRRFEAYQNRASAASLDLGRVNTLAVMLGTLFSQAMMIAVVAFGAPMAMEGTITLGTMIAVVILSSRVTQPVQRALGLWTRYQDFRLARADIGKTFALPVVERFDPEQLGEKEGRVEIRDLNFSYNEKEEPLLRNINLTLNRGDVISISGDRGTGKTTLLKLLAGLYTPSSGEVLIDGVPATRYPARELVRHIGYLPMDGMIFRGTIWDNISAFGEHDARSVSEIVQLLGLDAAIKNLPAGYDTKLEGGQSDAVAPGLRQRIALARALAAKPRVILFGNADRALDKEGYNRVYRLLARLRGKATMVIVTDDRNIARLARTHYVLTAGTLVEQFSAGDDSRHDILPYQELRL